MPVPRDTRASRLPAGAVIADRYRIEAVIAQGGAGAVYRAGDLDSGEPVALKVMHEQDPSGVAHLRFEREAALLSQLDHPHVVRVRDYGRTAPGQPFIVFSLLQGESLRAVLKRHGPLAPERVGRIAGQLLSALGAAHRLQILHRDIKPQNIFLADRDGQDHAVLLDFGLALGGGWHGARLTALGHAVGTPRYLSPEMARGEPATPSSDLYSLALVMAELLCGHPLVTVDSTDELRALHGKAQTLPLPERVLESPLCAVLQRALAKSQAVRYRTALQMQADLEAALSSAGPEMPGAAPSRRPLTADLAPTMVALPKPTLPGEPASPAGPRSTALATVRVRDIIMYLLIIAAAAVIGHLLGQ